MSTCPFSGFFLQSTSGAKGNFEVVVPWPKGGLAHYWRDNDASNLPWHGPNVFAQGDYSSCTLIESDYFTHDTGNRGNLEVLARRSDGLVDHYWRENAGSFEWFDGESGIFVATEANPTLAQTGWKNIEKWVGNNYVGKSKHRPFHSLIAQINSDMHYWNRLESIKQVVFWVLANTVEDSRHLAGIAFLISSVNSNYFHFEPDHPGDFVLSAISDRGDLRLYHRKLSPGGSLNDPVKIWWSYGDWKGPFIFGQDPKLPDLEAEFRGRPGIIQSNFGHSESDLPFTSTSWGNYEMVAPLKQGGIMHLWKENGGGDPDDSNITQHWHAQKVFGEPIIYDQLTIIQSNFGETEYGHLELIAYQNQQSGFHHFWRDDDLQTWHGPTIV